MKRRLERFSGRRFGYVAILRCVICCMIVCCITLFSGCGKRQDAYNNDRMKRNSSMTNDTESQTAKEEKECTVTEMPSDTIGYGEDAQGSEKPSDTGNNGAGDGTGNVVSGGTSDGSGVEVSNGASDGADNGSSGGMTSDASNSQPEKYKPVNANAVVKEDATYDCDIKADRAAYDGHVDIKVGDKFYATQINDWFMNFDQYEGKVVEIEGYYIGDFQPYDFVGRYGPSCPYCQGGYVSFEILSDEDLTTYQSAKDWIKVTGILRQGQDDAQNQPFYYIEALKLEKMDKVGKDTVTD